jgi:hypothetical protein
VLTLPDVELEGAGLPVHSFGPVAYICPDFVGGDRVQGSVLPVLLRGRFRRRWGFGRRLGRHGCSCTLSSSIYVKNTINCIACHMNLLLLNRFCGTTEHFMAIAFKPPSLTHIQPLWQDMNQTLEMTNQGRGSKLTYVSGSLLLSAWPNLAPLKKRAMQNRCRRSPLWG